MANVVCFVLMCGINEKSMVYNKSVESMSFGFT